MQTHEPNSAAPRGAPPAPELLVLWAQYAQHRDVTVRDRLVLAYLGFARIMAAKLYARRIVTEMEFSDYLQLARVGLLESVDRFEPGRAIRFETFAASRIEGAILNGIASSSELQEQVAARKRVVSQRLASLASDAPPPPGPVAVFARLAELAIGLAVGFALEDSGMHRAADAEYGDNSYHGIELKQLRARVQATVDSLPSSQRQVVQSHYLQHLPFEEVATAMRLSRGRISQIHKEALGNLRAKLQNLGEVDLRC